MAEGGRGEHRSNSLVLHIKNLPPGASEYEQLDMFLENATNQENFSVEYNDALNEALASFENLTIDPSTMIQKIAQKPFFSTELTVEEAQPKHRVVVTNVKPGTDKGILELYFEQAKFNRNNGDVRLEFDDVSRVAIVTFSDPSVIDIVLSANHASILGPDVVIERCKFFDSLLTFASGEEETNSNAGSRYSDNEADQNEREASYDETSSVTDETSSVTDETSSVTDENVAGNRGRGRGNRRYGRRGSRSGRRSGRPFFSGDPNQESPRRDYGRQVSTGSLNTEDRRGRRNVDTDRGNRRHGRGQRPARGTAMQHGADGRRPLSAASAGYSSREHESPEMNERNYAADEGLRSRRGGRPPFGGRGSRRGEGMSIRGQERGGMNQRAGSVPSLLDQNLSLPGQSHKEIEVKNEVRSEKCALLTTMIRDVRRHGCSAHVDFRRHRMILDGPESAVISAAEAVYTMLIDMHSVQLEIPAPFAQLLNMQRGRDWIVAFFKNAQIRAIYYTDADGNPLVIAADEFAAKSAEALLNGKIKTETLSYADYHKPYLESLTWTNFVTATENSGLLKIEVRLNNTIILVGVEDDVSAAEDSIRLQLSSFERQTTGRHGSSTSAVYAPRPVPKERIRPPNPVEAMVPCPVCGVQFARSTIVLHANQCGMEGRRCPVCSCIFTANTSAIEFEAHVDSHFHF